MTRMRDDTKNWIMMLFAFAAGAILALVVAFPAQAADTCPEEGKVESVVDGDLDDIVLPAGTEVCIKGSTTLVNVIADGQSTLRTLLGINKNVSHYTVAVPDDEVITDPVWEQTPETLRCEDGVLVGNHDGSITLTDGEHYRWIGKLTWTGLGQGVYEAKRAQAHDGYVFDGGKFYTTQPINIIREEFEGTCETTTTAPPTTTTTEPVSTTEEPSTTTTTPAPSSSTTTEPVSPTTTETTPPTTSTPPEEIPNELDELPFTGPGGMGFMALGALILLAGGVALLRTVGKET